jgi:hypothetical protein
MNRPASSAQRGRPRGSLFPEHDPAAGSVALSSWSPRQAMVVTPVPHTIPRSTPNNPAPSIAPPRTPACYRGSTTSPPLLLHDYLASLQSFQNRDLGGRTAASSSPGRRRGAKRRAGRRARAWRSERFLPVLGGAVRGRGGCRNPGMVKRRVPDPGTWWLPASDLQRLRLDLVASWTCHAATSCLMVLLAGEERGLWARACWCM